MFPFWLLLIKWAGKGSATAEFHHNICKEGISNSLKLTDEISNIPYFTTGDWIRGT